MPQSLSTISTMFKPIAQHEVELAVGNGDDFEWSHTQILLQKGGDFYTARSKRRMMPLERIDLSELDIDSTPIPTEHYRPLISSRLTVAPIQKPEDCHVKSPNLTSYDPRDETGLSRLLLREAEICELLTEHPHPNIVTYRGCIVEGNRVAGLCFTKYQQTLIQRINHDNRPFDIPYCLQQIEKGLQHLHNLGLVHNDINPMNIMLTKDDNTVIIDFNSCCEEGKKGNMGGTYLWTDDSYNDHVADRENDFCGMRKIREWLRDPAPFRKHGRRDEELHKQLGHHGQFGEDCYICR